MIKLQQLLVEGGLSFQDRTIFPLADQGLTRLVGLNVDEFAGSSNGSGKSSISDLLTHVIFATTAKGLKKNEIVCDMSPGGFYGQLDFSNAGVQYQIQQSRQHATLGTTVKLVVDGVDKKIKGINETQEAARLAVGLTLEEWLATTYMSQKSKHIFVRPNENTAKKELLARVFNLQYKQFQEAAEKKLKVVQEAMLQLKGSITASKKELDERLQKFTRTPEEYSREITALETEIQTLEASTARLRAAVAASEIRLSKQESKDTQGKIVTTALTLAGHQWKGSIPSAATFLEFIRLADEDILAKDTNLKLYESTVTRLYQRDAAKAALAGVEAVTPEAARVPLDLAENSITRHKLEELKKIEPQWFEDRQTVAERLAGLTQNYDQAIVDCAAEIVRVNNEITRLQTEQSTASKLLKGASEGTCSSCGQMIPAGLVETYRQTVDGLNAQLADLNTQAQELRTQKGILTQTLEYRTALETSKKAYEAKLGTWGIEAWRQALETLQVECDNFAINNTLYTDWVSAVKLLRQFDDLGTHTVEEYLPAVQQFQTELAGVRATRDTSQRLVEAVQAYERIDIPQVEIVDKLQFNGQCTVQEDRVKQLSDQGGVLKTELVELNGIIAQANAIKANEAEIIKLERQEAINSSLVYTFGPKGLLVERLETICDYMNDRTNAALSKIMRDNVLLKFYMDGDSIDLDIILNGKTRGVANLSGGEENKVGLACLLGLRSLIPDTHQVNLLIADEIDASWDDYVRAEMVELYQEMLRSTSLDTILVVTHSVPTRELPVWQTTWNVTKENGVSKLAIA